MNLSQLLVQLRTDIGDLVGTSVQGQTPTDTLWTDTQLVNYLNWALNRFASRTGMLRDAVSSVTNIPLVAGQLEYPLDPTILKVMSAKLNGATMSSWELSYVEIDPGANPDFSTIDLMQPFEYQYPKGWAVDYSKDTIYIWPAYSGYWPFNQPNGQPFPAQVNLRVVRIPLRQLNPLLLTQSPEIPIQYHMDLIAGAAYRALSVADTDAYSPESAATFKAMFEDAIMQARRDVRRRNNLMPSIIVGETGAW